MSKVSTKPETVSVLQMYYLFIKELLGKEPMYEAKAWKYITNGQVIDTLTGKVVIDYPTFKKVIATYNKKAGERIIKGFALDLGNGLGNLFMARIERPPNHGHLNMAESLKLRKKLQAANKLTAENWKVPYTDDDFIMLLWHKGNGLLRNIHLYKFKTAGGQPGKGFRQLISKTNMRNPHLKGLYPYLPCKTLEPIKNGI
jgi:hypothetical protein